MNSKVVQTKEVPVVVTSQALTVLEATDYSVDDFLEWALQDNKISFGGHNVVLFLEAMSKR